MIQLGRQTEEFLVLILIFFYSIVDTVAASVVHKVLFLTCVHLSLLIITLRKLFQELLVSLLLVIKNSSKSSLKIALILTQLVFSSLFYGWSHFWPSVALIRYANVHKFVPLIAYSYAICLSAFAFTPWFGSQQIHLTLILAGLTLAEFANFILKSTTSATVIKLLTKRLLQTCEIQLYDSSLNEVTVFSPNTNQKRSLVIQTDDGCIQTFRSNIIEQVTSPQSSSYEKIVVYLRSNDASTPQSEAQKPSFQKLKFKSIKDLLVHIQQSRNSEQFIFSTVYDSDKNKVEHRVSIYFDLGPHMVLLKQPCDSAYSLKQWVKLTIFKQGFSNVFQHKMKTPLNSAMFHLTAAKEDGNLDQEAKVKYIQPAILNCKIQLYFIQDIQDYMASEIEAASIQKVSIKALLLEVYELIEFQCRMKQIQILITLNDADIRTCIDRIHIFTDSTKLIRILFNLLNNSYRHTEELGSISLEVKTSNYNRFLFQISDSGKCMTASKIEELNNQFSLLESRRKDIRSSRGIKQNAIYSMRETDAAPKLGISLIVTCKLVKILGGPLGLLRASLNDQGGLVLTFSIEDSPEQLSDSSLEISKKQSFIKQQSLRMLQKQKQHFFPIKISQFQQTSSRAFNKMSTEDEEPIEQEPHPLQLPVHTHRAGKARKLKATIYQQMLQSKGRNRLQDSDLLDRGPLKSSRMISMGKISHTQRSINNKLASYVAKLNSHQLEDSSSKVLIVDDEPFNHDTLTLMLQKQGYKNFLRAYNGQQCVDVVSKFHEQLALIFMDIDMPILNGIQATKIILDYVEKNQIRYIPIIGCTAHEDQECHLNCYEAGMIYVIVKPIFQRSLVEALHKVKLLQEINIDLQQSQPAGSLSSRST